MAITYKWNIYALDAHVSHEGKSDVIYTVHYGLNGSEGDHSDNMIGTYSLEYDKDNFIEYDKLQKSDVESWLEAGLDVDSMKENLSNQIALLEKPVDVVLRPDW